MPTERVFKLESVIDRMFETLYPPVPPAQQRDGLTRAFRPILNNAMGSLVPEVDQRQLIEKRAYYKVDIEDFLEYATSSLPPQATIGRYPDGVACFYEFLLVSRKRRSFARQQLATSGPGALPS